MSLRAAAQQALEALERLHRTGDTQVFDMFDAPVVIPALRAALAEPEQEPVAWMDREGDVYKELPCANWCPPHTPLYTRDDTALLRQALEALESDPKAMVEVEPAQWEYKRTIVATALRERLALSDAALLAPEPGQLKDRGKK